MEPIKYQYLGYKTFFLFTLKRSKLFFIFLLLSLTFSLIGNNLNGNISLVFNKIALIGFWLALIFFGIALLSAWFEYINYRFILDENAFKVRRGILRKEEIAIPYRQIQNVNIKRNFIDQVIGVSKLIILTAGREDKDEAIWTESEGVLPSVNKNLAQKIQDELLRKANVEQVVMK